MHLLNPALLQSLPAPASSGGWGGDNGFGTMEGEAFRFDEGPVMSTVSYPHIELSSNGVAFLEGTRTKVVEIALDRLSHHWDAEEIQRQHAHLTLGQIYAALAFYHDHREAFDKEIAEQLRDVDTIAARQGASLLQAKLNKGGGST